MKMIKTLLTAILLITVSSMMAQTNIALTATATASSENQAASNAIDGNDGTRWESASSDPQWINLELDALYSIDSIRIHWEAANSKVYTIEVSEDNSSWTTVHTESNGAEGQRWDTISLSLASVKYIKLTGTERNLTYGHSIWEFEVYGTKVAGKDASLSDLTVDGTTISGFSGSTLTYNYGLANGVTTVPTVAATTTDAGASKVINDAASIPGTTTVVVTSQDGTVDQTYSINFIYTTPSDAPAAPTKDAANVISVYSDTYTSNYTNLNPGWGQATTFSEEDFSGNMVMKYANLNYQGLEYTNPTDVSGMDYLHLDYWTADATALEIYLIAGGENSYNIGTELGITSGEWVSVDIPLSHYEDAGRNLAAAFQFKTTGNGTVYIDNFYFWKEPTASSADVTLASLTIDGDTVDGFSPTIKSYSVDLAYGTTTVPTVAVTTTNASATHVVTDAASIPGTTTVVVTAENGTDTETYTVEFSANTPTDAAPSPSYTEANVISVYSDAYATNIATNLNPGWGQATVATEEVIAGNNTLKYASLNYQGTEYTQSDVSGMTHVHFDYWTADATALSFSVISVGPLENAYDIAANDGITLGSWVSVNIPLTEYTTPNLTEVFQFKTEGNGTVYIDNLLFWKDTATGLNKDAATSVQVISLKGALQIQTAEPTDIKVFNISGQQVFAAQNEGLLNVDLQKGIYIVKANNQTLKSIVR